MNKFKQVDAKFLSEIFDEKFGFISKYDNEYTEEMFSLLSDGPYNLESHWNYFQQEISTRKFSKNIDTELERDGDSFQHNEPYYQMDFFEPKLAITFKNINFIFNNSIKILLPSLDFYEKNSGVMVTFSSCKFFVNGSDSYHINCGLCGNSSLHFEYCEFQSIDILVAFEKFSNGKLIFSNCTINSNSVKIMVKEPFDVTGATVKELGVSIQADEMAKIYGASYFENRLTEYVSDKKRGALAHVGGGLSDPRHSIQELLDKESDIELKHLCRILLYDSQKLHVSAHQLRSIQGKVPKIEIYDCKMKTLSFGGKGEFRFFGNSSFSCLYGGGPPSEVYWGGGQEFNTLTKDFAFRNRIFFLNLKANAEVQKDAFQALMIQKDLAKCHHSLLRFEPSNTSLQDRIIFRFSWLASYYGTSWVRALIMIVVFNFFVLVFFASIDKYQNSCDIGCLDLIVTWANAFLELFNPIAQASSHFCVRGWWLTFFDWIHKFFYAAFAYEFVKSVRRFGRANS